MAAFSKPDLCILGGGALGTSLALKARQRGRDVMLIRLPTDAQNDPTGADLRRAAFMASAARAHALRDAARLGLQKIDPKPNFRAISEHAETLAETLVPRDSDDRLAALGIAVLAGETTFIDRQTLRVGEVQIRARQFVLAAGGAPLIPAIVGLDQVPYFTPRSIADNLRKLTHLVVIGGTPVALELAQAYARLGSQVTLVPQGGLLPGFDSELVALLMRDLREEGVTILEGTEVTAIQPRKQGTGIALGDGSSLDASHILVAMGDRPDLGLLDTRLKPRVTVVETVGQFFDHKPAPLFVQTSPPLAQFGDTTTGAQIWRTNLSENEAVRSLGYAAGLVKLTTNKQGTIIGAALYGQGAGELVAMLHQAGGRHLGDYAGLVLPQPSLASALTDLAEQFLSQTKRKGGSLFHR